ncbi:MAG: conjugal transfer protein TraF [Endomicrobium sp.]|nr:conjugal transfer protein TraF [Endomicrobium sp.]
MKSKIVILTVLTLVFSSIAFASQPRKEKEAVIKGLRPMGMGGAFTAVSNDENVFFYNPAGITRKRSDCLVQFSAIEAAVSSQKFDYYNFYKDNKVDLHNFGNLPLADKSRLLIQAMENVNYIFISGPKILFIAEPIDVAENSLNFGFGIFSYADLSFDKLRPLSFEMETAAMGILPVAFKIKSLKAIKLPGSLSLGANFKYMYRAKSFGDSMMIVENYDKYVFVGGKSFGIDLGTIYHLNSHWNFGLSIADFYGSEIEYKKFNLASYRSSEICYTAKVNPKLNFGAAYINGKFVFAFDLTDLMNPDFGEVTIKNLLRIGGHVGAEYKFGIFVIRGGLNFGYPTIGGGIVSDVIRLEYAFYGEEKGNYACRKPAWFHRIALSFRF